MPKKHLFVLLLLLSVSPQTRGATTELKPHFTVHLIIAANNDLKSIVENNLTRELSKRSDVDVTQDEAADWLLYLNVTPIIDSKGLKGYIVAAIITDQYSANVLRNLPAADFKSPQIAERIKTLTQDQVRLHDHLVQTCPPDGIPAIMAKLVDYFDENFLMAVREDVTNFNLRAIK